jgi:DNA-binding CsgD family transcriptional regulator
MAGRGQRLRSASIGWSWRLWAAPSDTLGEGSVSRRQASGDVVSTIYEAALEPLLWPEALKGMARRLSASSAVALVVDLAAAEVGFAALTGLDPHSLESYGAHYARVDPWNEYLGRHPCGRPYFSQAAMDDSDFERTEFCNDFLRRYGIFHALGGFVVRSSSLAFLCGVQRPRARGAFTLGEMRRMAALFPHLDRAARLHRRLARAGGLADGLTAALDRVPLAVLLCDGLGRAVWMNRLAEMLVRRNDGLRVTGGRLETTAASALTAQLRRLIGSAARSSGATIGNDAVRDAVAADDDDADQAGGVMQLPRHWPLKALTVMVAPLATRARAPDLALDLARPAAMLLISDPDRAVALPADRLARAFGLTAAEARLAAALATGTSLTDYAGRAQITIGTARWYLKQALAKTNSHRQSELVRCVITTVGGLEAVAVGQRV